MIIDIIIIVIIVVIDIDIWSMLYRGASCALAGAMVSDECAFCLRLFSNEVCSALVCGHLFHEKCLIKNETTLGLASRRDMKCPTCRLRARDVRASRVLAGTMVSGECAMCSGRFSTKACAALECGHLFHEECLTKNETVQCPSCRLRAREVPDIVTVDDSLEDPGLVNFAALVDTQAYSDTRRVFHQRPRSVM